MDRYAHMGLVDTAAALDMLPELPAAAPKKALDAVRATGTCDAPRPRPDRALTKPVSLDAPKLITPETIQVDRGETGICRKSLKAQALESDCDRLRTSETKQAPPGFEPGMADLQSHPPSSSDSAFFPEKTANSIIRQPLASDERVPVSPSNSCLLSVY
jgi:hypothetical protein